jgi:hypothetical protein
MRKEHPPSLPPISNSVEELGGLLAKLGQPIEQTAREIIVLELYRRSLISSGASPWPNSAGLRLAA